MFAIRPAFILASAFVVPVLFAADTPEEPLSQVKTNVESGKAVLVDVRQQREWDAGHVEGAILLPLGSIEDGLNPEEAAKLPKEKVVYLHCAIGLRAAAAGEALEKLGYKVRPLDVDYKALVKAGFEKAKD